MPPPNLPMNPIQTYSVQVDATLQTMPAWPGRSGQVVPARDQQAYGPWVVNGHWYILLADANTDFNPAIYVSLNLGLTWTIVDAAHSPTYFSDWFMAPVLVNNVAYIAYRDSSVTGGDQSQVGLVVRQFHFSTGQYGAWDSTCTAQVPTAAYEDIYTWDLIVNSPGNYFIVYTHKLSGSATYLTSLIHYSSGAWGVPVSLDPTFANPMISGFAWDAVNQRAYVHYSQSLLSATAFPSPNPVMMVTVDINGNIGAPQTVIPNIVPLVPPLRVFTYPAIDATVSLPDGTLISVFGHQANSHAYVGSAFFPCYVMKPAGSSSWNSWAFVSDGPQDEIALRTGGQTTLVVSGDWAYPLWLTSNTYANEIRVTNVNATGLDPNIYELFSLTYQTPNFDYANNGGGYNLMANFDPTGVGHWMLAFGYQDSTTYNSIAGFVPYGVLPPPIRCCNSGYVITGAAAAGRSLTEEPLEPLPRNTCVVPSSTYLTPIYQNSQPYNRPTGTSSGPYVYNNNLYVIGMIDNGTLYNPQVWKSTDNGLTWNPLPVDTANDWVDYSWGFTAWNPLYKSNIITFMHGSSLIDYDLATESWGTLYATNEGDFLNIPNMQCSYPYGLVRLSDGRLRVVYVHDPPGNYIGPSPGSIYWAVANTGGSGLWDSIDNLIMAMDTVTYTGSYSYGPGVDSSDTMHFMFEFNNYNTNLFTMYYGNVTSGNVTSTPSVVSLPTGAGYGLDSLTPLIAGSDGKLYSGTVQSDPVNGGTAVVAWIGSNLTNPSWSREKVANYLNDPTVAYIQETVCNVLGNQVGFFWRVERQDGSLDVRFSQGLSGSWAPAQVYVDFSIQGVPPPYEPSGGGFLNGSPWSFAAYDCAKNNIGLVLNCSTQLVSDPGNEANYAFYVLPYAPPPIRCCNSGWVTAPKGGARRKKTSTPIAIVPVPLDSSGSGACCNKGWIVAG